MAQQARILKIARMGDPILQKISKRVENPLAPEVTHLIEDMEATVKHMNCSGLAAPQVFSLLRIVIFRILKTTDNPSYELTPEYDPEGVPWTVMINPKVRPLSDEKNSGWESCLSLPGLMGKVARYHSIEYSFLNKKGQEEKRVAHGFHARVVQHECDHLDGILYPQRMEDISTLGFKEDILRSSASTAEEARKK
ncbi:MAG: peptide deformylase [Alphaproteobacteria bacterium]|nr:peptide deformylase [Alphaproteobacteria bacterium]